MNLFRSGLKFNPKETVRLGVVLLLLITHSKLVYAQAPPPPRPPVMEPPDDFDEADDEDYMEMGDEPYQPVTGTQPPVPPRPGGGPVPGAPPSPENPNPTPMYAPNSTTFKSGKLHFRVVIGEFWEKGRKRPRGVRGGATKSSSSPL